VKDKGRFTPFSAIQSISRCQRGQSHHAELLAPQQRRPIKRQHNKGLFQRVDD
jgi:hypothetical protein